MAQNVYNGLTTQSDTTSGIIREGGIAYYEERGEGRFICVPSTLSRSTHYVKTPIGWSVKDFHVHENTAYFCGIDHNTGWALLGHFDIGDLVSGLPTVTFYNNSTMCNSILILNRIAVNGDKDNLSLIAIGSETYFDPDEEGADVVLYTKNYNAGKFCLYRNTGSDEIFWDVTAADNSFALVGTLGMPTKYFTLRNIPFGVDQCVNTEPIKGQYTFTCEQNFLSGIHATALKQDTIALASYHSDTRFVCMQVFTIYLPTAQMYYNQRYSFLSSSPAVTKAGTERPDLFSRLHSANDNRHEVLCPSSRVAC